MRYGDGHDVPRKPLETWTGSTNFEFDGSSPARAESQGGHRPPQEVSKSGAESGAASIESAVDAQAQSRSSEGALRHRRLRSDHRGGAPPGEGDAHLWWPGL